MFNFKQIYFEIKLIIIINYFETIMIKTLLYYCDFSNHCCAYLVYSKALNLKFTI